MPAEPPSSALVLARYPAPPIENEFVSRFRNRERTALLPPKEEVLMGDRTQRVKGKAQEVKGKAKANAGHSTGKSSTEAKGVGEMAKGKANKAAGKARSAAKKATR